jgi:regulation of enolase protein 1 (concanavalin A-like superfamily)
MQPGFALFLVFVLSLIAAAADSTLFEDPFKSTLSPGWTWVREDKADWRIKDGALQVHATPGNLWEAENGARNLLLRAPPKETRSFAAEVTVSHTPVTFGEQAGLLWYRDDDNYVKLVKEWYDGKTWAVFAVERGGKAEYREADCRAEWVTFRLTITGDTVSAAFRPVGGTDWTSMDQFKFDPRDDARIGITAHHAPRDSDRWSYFRDFRLERREPK